MHFFFNVARFRTALRSPHSVHVKTSPYRGFYQAKKSSKSTVSLNTFKSLFIVKFPGEK